MSVSSENIFNKSIKGKIVLVILLLTSMLSAQTTSRIKDICRLENVRDNQLIGYGLVVGLAGTGDGNGNQATLQGISNMLSNFGVQIDATKINGNNVAAVMVTGKIRAFNVTGDLLDVDVSSIGKAKSLRGGTLLLTPLKGANGVVYSVAQGAVSIGGHSASSQGSSSVQNHVTSGRIPNGAIVEKSIVTPLNVGNELTWVLDDEDFGTVDNIRQAIQKKYGDIKVKVSNASRFTINIPDKYKDNIVQLIAQISDLEVAADMIARIVVNEKTGSVVMGGPIKIAPVAIAHEDLNISIQSDNSVSQPASLSGGQTTIVKGSIVDINSSKETTYFKMIKDTNTIEDLVSVLNNIGVTPSGIISILQLMKEIGAIKAKLEIV